MGWGYHALISNVTKAVKLERKACQNRILDGINPIQDAVLIVKIYH